MNYGKLSARALTVWSACVGGCITGYGMHYGGTYGAKNGPTSTYDALRQLRPAFIRVKGMMRDGFRNGKRVFSFTCA